LISIWNEIKVESPFGDKIAVKGIDMKFSSRIFNKYDCILFVVILLIMPLFLGLETNFLYQFERSKVENIQAGRVVVFYDDFDGTHGESVVNVFLNRVDLNLSQSRRYEILKINSKSTKIEVMQKMIEHLLDQNKQVFLNSSVTPIGGSLSHRWERVYNLLLSNKNITITQATGNNIHTELLFGKEVVHQVYKLLNEQKKELREIALNLDDSRTIKLFGSYGQFYVNLKEVMGSGRNNKMKSFIEEVIQTKYPSKSKQQKEEIIDVYTDLANVFSFAIMISHKNPRVTLVGSSSSLKLSDGAIIEHFLDFKVKGLIRIDKREVGFIGEGENIKVGTSISAPIALASFLNNDK